jgi:hypothetical protein
MAPFIARALQALEKRLLTGDVTRDDLFISYLEGLPSPDELQEYALEVGYPVTIEMQDMIDTLVHEAVRRSYEDFQANPYTGRRMVVVSLRGNRLRCVGISRPHLLL